MPIIRLITTLVIVCSHNFSLAQVGVNAGVLNPNLAERAELIRLDGVSDAIATTMLAARPIVSNAELDGIIGDALTPNEKVRLRRMLFLPINLNSANDDELLLVPGIGERMAHEFEEYRPYTSIDQFRREIGKYVDDQEVARLEQYVFVPINLNSASSEALASIPGMSSRMVHEFEEYRPYASLEQFRREIGKYVDADEVARLERYVYLK